MICGKFRLELEKLEFFHLPNFYYPIIALAGVLHTIIYRSKCHNLLAETKQRPRIPALLNNANLFT
jgi:hypothetical protein